MPHIEDHELDQDPFDLLAEEFAAQCRRGEEPTIDEYVVRYPEHADSIRLLFPAVALLERGKLARTRSGSGFEGASSSGVPGIERLGDHRIIREVGRGGMGVVYEAEQESLGRRVAVKVLRGHSTADAGARRRFLREARAVARLKHPNIIAIHAVGEADDIPYLVMELVDGVGLDRLLAEDEQMEHSAADSVEHARWVARIGQQAASALSSAHAQGILHRDVKPGNLLVDRSGKLWLADFGLARLVDDLTVTGSGELPGTLRYLAPECLRGEGDALSDVYSLGVTLYELLVGRPAFPETDRIRLLRQVEGHAIVPPRKVDPTIPADLETIVLTACAHEPSARYASAMDLAEDLGRFLEGYPLKARRPSLTDRARFWIRRNPVVAALTATSILLAIFGLYFFMLFLLAPPRPPRPPRFGAPPARRPFPPPALRRRDGRALAPRHGDFVPMPRPPV